MFEQDVADLDLSMLCDGARVSIAYFNSAIYLASTREHGVRLFCQSCRSGKPAAMDHGNIGLCSDAKHRLRLDCTSSFGIRDEIK